MRLKGFDYRRPFFYMVTLKRLPGLADFSRITDAAEPPRDSQGRPCPLVANAITRAFEQTIRHFHEQWWGLWPVDCFAIMPDHIHLLIRLRDTGDQLPLGKYVYHLMKALATEYWRQTGLPPQNAGLAAPVPSGASPPPVFERQWHDWITASLPPSGATLPKTRPAPGSGGGTRAFFRDGAHGSVLRP